MQWSELLCVCIVLDLALLYMQQSTTDPLTLTSVRSDLRSNLGLGIFVEHQSAHLLIFLYLLKVGTVWVNCWLVRDLNVPFGGAKM